MELSLKKNIRANISFLRNERQIYIHKFFTIKKKCDWKMVQNKKRRANMQILQFE